MSNVNNDHSNGPETNNSSNVIVNSVIYDDAVKNVLISNLKAKVQTLKNLSSVKQDLMTLRELQAKELIVKLKFFEEAVGNEKHLRAEFVDRVESAEAQCIDLTERLRDNVAKLADVKCVYENKIVGLIADFKAATHDNIVSRSCIRKLETKVVELEKQLLSAENGNEVYRADSTEMDDLKRECESLKAKSAEFDDVKRDYENKLADLIMELETSKYENIESKNAMLKLETNVVGLEERLLAAENGNGNNQKVVTASVSVQANISDNDISEIESCSAESDMVRDLKTQLEEATEKNRVLAYQMTLLNTLFLETEETSIDFDRIRAIGDIVRESMELAKAAGNAGDGGNNDDNQMVTLSETDDENLAVCDGDIRESRKPSFDVSGIIEKLDASNEKKIEDVPGEESCYKSVDTTAGPKLVLSVSRTFIKLKDLILEKKSLQRDIDGLKELNEKLSVKVDQEERRLYCVTGELNKTWRLVATLKAQHKQLHNSKAVLRYELQEKRKLLEKLKRDLSLSREKWIRVRQKNSESELECLKIREEFSRRRQEKISKSQESAFFSGESGQQSPTSSNSEDVPVKKSPVQAKRHAKSKGRQEPEPEPEPVEDSDPADLAEEILEGACGIDYISEVADFDDPLDELEDLAEEIKTIEAAAAISDDDENDEDDDSTIFRETEVNWERLVNRRAARLQILEEQCRQLCNKLSASKVRSVTLTTKLAHLHDHYGSDSDDTTTTDQSRPTEPSDDTAYASGFGQHLSDELGHENDGDLDNTEMPSSEIESQDEQDMIVVTKNSIDNPLAPVSINSNVYSETGTSSHHNTSQDVEIAEQIASESRELQVEETVGQSTDDDVQDRTTTAENATIIITDEAIEQIATRESLLVVRTSPLPVPTSQNLNIIVNTDESCQNLASTNNTSTASAFVANQNHNGHHYSRNEPTVLNHNNMIPMNSLNPQTFASAAPSSSSVDSSRVSSFTNTTDIEDDNTENDDDEMINPSDLSTLGRLIIQQLPKRLDILKNENAALMEEMLLGDKILKKTEQELENQKRICDLLQNQIEAQNIIESKLQEELDLQQQIIQELKNEIGKRCTSFDNLMSEKQKFSNFMEIFKQDQLICDQRLTAKAMPRKNCSLCRSKFTFFKKKCNCKICGYDFCNKCSSERRLGPGITDGANANSSRQKTKIQVCTTCFERKQKLDALVAEIHVNVDGVN